MEYQEPMLCRIQHCLRMWTMQMISCQSLYPQDRTSLYMVPHHILEQMAAHHTLEKEEFRGSASSAVAKVPVPKKGSAHPILMRAEECLRAATQWLPKDSAMECQHIGEVLEATLRTLNFVEEMQVNGILPQKNHGENRSL